MCHACIYLLFVVNTGNCNDLCARLTVNSSTTDFYQNSNVTFYSTIEINLLAPLTAADELGVFRFLKDGDGINNFSRISHTAINSPNISFYILNAQLSDSGVYQFVYLSSHAELYTNRVSIDVHPIASSTIITKSVASKQLLLRYMHVYMVTKQNLLLYVY